MATSADRLLIHRSEQWGQISIMPTDPLATDDERAKAGLPTLANVVAETTAENMERARQAAHEDGLLPGVPLRRVWRDPAPAELQRRWDAEQSMLWFDSDELTAVYRSAAAEVYVAGSFEMPMWPVPGSDLWAITVRIPNVSRAVLPLTFIELTEAGNLVAGMGRRREDHHTIVWRGPDAPAPPSRTIAEREKHNLWSTALGEERTIYVSMPASKPEAVAYGTDGSCLDVARTVRVLEARREVPPTAFVGIPSRFQPGDDVRGREYMYGRDPEHYEAHRRFFTQEVPAWLSQTYGIALPRDRTIVHGASLGGAFAANAVIHDPELFGGAIVLSAGTTQLEPRWEGWDPPRYALGGGTLEPGLQQATAELTEKLRRAGAPHVVHEWVGGHDGICWSEAFPGLFAWMFDH